MPSFDVVSEVDLQEVRNATDQASREVGQRFDFKGSDAHFESSDNEITLVGENKFQLEQMMDILEKKLVKRGVDIGAMDISKPDLALSHARQVVTIKQGVDTDTARKIVKDIKANKLKVQARIQGDQVRVTGKKRDDLQEVIAFLRTATYELPLQFTNFRD